MNLYSVTAFFLVRCDKNGENQNVRFKSRGRDPKYFCMIICDNNTLVK